MRRVFSATLPDRSFGAICRRIPRQPHTVEEIEEYRTDYMEATRVLKAAVGVGEIDMLRPLLEEFLRLYRYQITASEADMRRLTLAYGRTVLRINEKLLARYDGKDEPTPTLARQLGTPTLSKAIQDYIEYYQRRGKPSMLRKIQAVMPLFLDIVGDKPIGSLKQTDLEHFFDTIQCLPPRWADVCRQKNMRPRDLAKLRLGEIAKGTFDGTYLAAMTPFVTYCRRKLQDSAAT